MTDQPIPGLETVRETENPDAGPVADVPRADPYAFELTPPTHGPAAQAPLDFGRPPDAWPGHIYGTTGPACRCYRCTGRTPHRR